MRDASVSVVVPVKPVSAAKTRLSPHLSPESRADLSIAMLTWVLEVLRESEVAETIVVGGDDRVRMVCSDADAIWKPDSFLDLNLALAHAFQEIWSTGGAAAYIPSDLPLLTSKEMDRALELSDSGQVLTLCPAYDGGTNGMIFPRHTGLTPMLGRDSFSRHKSQAEQFGLEARVFRTSGFERDVDTIDDLLACVGQGAPCLAGFAHIAAEIAQ